MRDRDASERTPGKGASPWVWQRRVVLGIFLGIGLFYAVAFPLVTTRVSLIPLGLVFIVLAIAVSVWWPRAKARDN